MLIAVDQETGDRVLGSKATRGHEYRCPGCDATPLVVKQGDIMIHHFAHPSTAESCESEPETYEHASGKLAVAAAWNGSVEVKLGRRRADVAICPDWLMEIIRVFNGDVEIQPNLYKRLMRYRESGLFTLADEVPIVVEVQCSHLDPKEWWQRTADYNALGIAPLWVWGLNRLSFHQESWYGDEQEFKVDTCIRETATYWDKSSLASILIDGEVRIARMRYCRYKDTLRKIFLHDSTWFERPAFTLQHVWGAQWGRHRPHGVWVASPVPSPDAEWEWDIADLIEYGRQRSRGGTAE